MIQYIVAAGLGALIGSAQKGKKKYKKGGAVMKKDPPPKEKYFGNLMALWTMPTI